MTTSALGRVGGGFKQIKVSEDKSCSQKNGLICIEYPGRVENVANAVESLGGYSNIAQVSEENHRRLELRFRYNDRFSKPACGEKAVSNAVSSFLLKVSKWKVGDSTEIRTEIIGIVDTTFKFGNLCDFQYLPMATKPVRDISDKIFFKSLVSSSEWFDETENENVPLFIPPAVFSRMDVPQDYYQYRKEGYLGKDSESDHIIGRTRKRRSHHGIFVNFDVTTVPRGPLDEVSLERIQLRFAESFEIITSQFKERPIWSKNALHASTQIAPERFKLILPSIAYYFINGPWRNQWVRFGYDPRSDPTSSIYQTLDYRIRITGGARNRIKAKRSYANYLLPYKSIMWTRPKTSVIDREALLRSSSTCVEEDTEKVSDDLYIFRSGYIPPYRQMFYQFGDIKVEEAQELIIKNGRKELCDERNGWFIGGTDSQLRDIINHHINLQLEREQNGSEEQRHEDTLSDEDDALLDDVKFLQSSSSEEEI